MLIYTRLETMSLHTLWEANSFVDALEKFGVKGKKCSLYGGNANYVWVMYVWVKSPDIVVYFCGCKTGFLKDPVGLLYGAMFQI